MMAGGGALGAFLCFTDRFVYPAYVAAPYLFGMTPIEDQAFAGALMWVFGTFVYLAPAVIITIQLLSPQTRRQPRETGFSPQETADHPARGPADFSVDGSYSLRAM